MHTTNQHTQIIRAAFTASIIQCLFCLLAECIFSLFNYISQKYKHFTNILLWSYWAMYLGHVGWIWYNYMDYSHYCHLKRFTPLAWVVVPRSIRQYALTCPQCNGCFRRYTCYKSVKLQKLGVVFQYWCYDHDLCLWALIYGKLKSLFYFTPAPG